MVMTIGEAMISISCGVVIGILIGFGRMYYRRFNEVMDLMEDVHQDQADLHLILHKIDSQMRDLTATVADLNLRTTILETRYEERYPAITMVPEERRRRGRPPKNVQDL